MRILVALDGSRESNLALTRAMEIADATDGSLTAVHAIDPAVHDEGGSEPITEPGDADDRLILQSVDDAEDRGLAILEDAEERAAELGLSIETELLYGEPVRAITEYVESSAYDAVVVGHQGRSARAESMLGSVAKGIVERAPVPVTVVR